MLSIYCYDHQSLLHWQVFQKNTASGWSMNTHRYTNHWNEFSFIFCIKSFSLCVEKFEDSVNKNHVWYISLGFSLSAWRTQHGISTSGPLDIHNAKLLLQNLGVAPYVKDPTDRCDWTSPMYSGANAEGWSDGRKELSNLANLNHSQIGNFLIFSTFFAFLFVRM